MKKYIALVGAGIVLASGLSAKAELAVDAGLKLWYAEPKVTDRAMMFGPAAMASLDDLFWMRAFYLYGSYGYIQSREPRSVQSLSIHDAELSGGINWDIFHFGGGLRSMSVVTEQTGGNENRVRTPNAWGPTAVAGASQSFSEWPWGFTGSPWGWYAGVSWMLYDMEDNDGEHVNFEAGITHVGNLFYTSIGYRFKETFDHERMEGFTAVLMVAF